MRVSSNSYLQSSLRQLQQLQNAQQVRQAQLATGQKIQKISDDPVNASNILKNQAEQKELVQYRDNSSKANHISQAGYDSLEQLHSIYENTDALIANPTFQEDKAKFIQQLDAFIESAFSAANSKYNDEYLFAGTETGSVAFSAERNPDTDEITSVAFQGANDDGRSFNISEGVNLSPFSTAETTSGISDFINGLIAYKDAIVADDSAAQENAAQTITDSEDAIVNGMSELSMKQYRIEILSAKDTAKYAAFSQENTGKLAVDTTEVVVDLMNTQKAYQGALQSMSKIMNISLLNYM